MSENPDQNQPEQPEGQQPEGGTPPSYGVPPADGPQQPGPGYPPPPGPQGSYPPPGQPGGYGQPAYAQGGYGQQAAYDPNAPYGYDPKTGLPFSDKQKLIAGLLNIFISGVGRMYAGQVGIGVAQLVVAIVTCGIGALWSLIDGILMLTGDPVDGQGRPLRS